MAVSRSGANAGRKTHHNKPDSKLSGQKYVTKPESRHPNTHNYSVSQAESQVKGFGSGK